jgi:hypothetical protein
MPLMNILYAVKPWAVTMFFNVILALYKQKHIYRSMFFCDSSQIHHAAIIDKNNL